MNFKINLRSLLFIFQLRLNQKNYLVVKAFLKMVVDLILLIENLEEFLRTILLLFSFHHNVIYLISHQ